MYSSLVYLARIGFRRLVELFRRAVLLLLFHLRCKVPVASLEDGVAGKLARAKLFWKCLRQWDGHVTQLLQMRPDKIRINEAQGLVHRLLVAVQPCNEHQRGIFRSRRALLVFK